MAKLKYRLQFTGSGGFGDDDTAGIVSAYLAGASGTPETRAYPIADIPPAFGAYPLLLGYVGNPVIADGDYYVDYKDGGTANQRLAKIKLIDYASSCWTDDDFVNPTYELIRFETYIMVRAGTSAGASCQASIDGTNWKNLVFAGVGTETTFTNAEILAAGITGNVIPFIRTRRNRITVKKDIQSFEESTYPGFSGFGYTLITWASPDTSSGLIVGDVIEFQNSALYSSATIVAIPGTDAIVISYVFQGDEAGVTCGIPVACSAVIAEDFFIGELSFEALTLGETHTNETSQDANDGTINLIIAGGSGSYSIAWLDGSIAVNRSGLPAGIYNVTVTDDVTLEELSLEITITEPEPEPIPVGTYLDVPKMQTLRFVREAVIDNCNTFQTFDNTLFCKMVFFGVKVRTPFYQKVCKCDLFPIQIHSNFPSHEVTIRNLVTDALVKTLAVPTLKQQLTGLVSSYDMYFTDSDTGAGDPVGTSRVFFDSGTIPIVVNIGDAFTVINNADGFNGNYSIVGISNDPLLGAPYLLVTLVYDGPDPTSAGTAQFSTNTLDFDIYETVFDAQDVAEGLYYVRVRGINVDASFTDCVCEPINLKVTHPGTMLVEARNFDNASGIVFTTGFNIRMRLESKLQKPVPGRVDENYRESNGSPVKLSSKPQRKYKFEYFSQPFYRLELLAVLWGWDQILVNKVEYESDEGTSEPANRDFFLLANGNVTIEQKQWFEQYNGDDLGSVDPGFILTQYGYIQRT